MNSGCSALTGTGAHSVDWPLSASSQSFGASAAFAGNKVVYIGNRGDQSVCAYDAISFAKVACGTLDSTPAIST